MKKIISYFKNICNILMITIFVILLFKLLPYIILAGIVMFILFLNYIRNLFKRN